MRQEPKTPREKELVRKITAAQHAVQSGIALHMNYDPTNTEPKHLRVGVDTALVGNGAIAELLIRKGVFTLEDYLETLLEATLDEVAMYKAIVTADMVKATGRSADEINITLA